MARTKSKGFIEGEFADFPSVENDDVTDAMAQAFPYQHWFAKTAYAKQQSMAKALAGINHDDYVDWSSRFITTDHTNPDPPQPTKFWECESCGTVSPINVLDCRGCGHSITKKAMMAAWEAEQDEDEDTEVDYAELGNNINIVLSEESAKKISDYFMKWRIGM
jgi:hypothetical protein